MGKGTVGIYKIENIESGRVYIGYSSCIHDRINTHLKNLNNNSHMNKFLQSDWNNFGKDNFKFSIEHIIDTDDKISDKEMLHIGLYIEGVCMDKYEDKYNKLNKHHIFDSNNLAIDITIAINKTLNIFNEKDYIIHSQKEKMTIVRTRRRI